MNFPLKGCEDFESYGWFDWENVLFVVKTLFLGFILVYDFEF